MWKATWPSTIRTRPGPWPQVISADKAFGVIFIGKQAIDNDSYQLHILLAEEAGRPGGHQCHWLSPLKATLVKAQREIDEGAKEMIEMAIPCVVAAAKGLNTPRYASMMGIMKAKKIEIKKITLAEINISESQNKVQPAQALGAGRKTPGTDHPRRAGRRRCGNWSGFCAKKPKVL